MKPFEFKKFVPISKVDNEKRRIYGYASTPDLDSDGEIIKLSALEKALPSYMKFPTIREMHQPKAVGKTLSAEVRNGDGKKGLYISAKIVADDAWKLVKEGVYTAFSVGGNVVQRAGNIINELDLTEISLVDVPANKAAVIELWKREGGKVAKNADGVMMISNLMSHAKDVAMMMEMNGKKTKKIDSMIEQMKQMIAEEAAEPEDMGKIAKYIDALAKIYTIRKEVNLMKKDQKLKKDDEITPDDEEEESAEDADDSEGAEGDADEAEAESEDEESDEDVDADEESDEESDEEEKVATATLSKINKKLEKMAPAKKAATSSLAKVVSSLTGTVAKMSDVLEDITARLEKVEGTPAATKSKSVAVFKSDAEKDEKQEKANDNKVSGELTALYKRRDELNGLRDEMGAAKFAKTYGHEAARLLSRIDQAEGVAR